MSKRKKNRSRKTLKAARLPIGNPQKKLKRLTEKIFVGFLNDLRNLENSGYDESECTVVKEALKEMEVSSQKIASSTWMQLIALDYGDFRKAYHDWNGEGTKTTIEAVTSRRNNLETLTQYRSKWKADIAKKIKSNVGGDAAAGAFADKVVELFQNLTDKYPVHFRELRGNVEQYVTMIA